MKLIIASPFRAGVSRQKAALVALAFAVGLALTAGQASAFPIGGVPCPGNDDLAAGERQMELDPAQGTASCDGWGTGGGPEFEPVGQVHEAQGFTLISKVDDADGTDGFLTVTGIGGTAGSIEIDPGVYGLYDDIFVVFKFGFAQVSPDWMRYLVDGVFEADWAVDLSQALSNVALYGRGETGTVPVPAPAPLALLGLGLLGLGFARRRR
jgi:hypothetical protein